MTLDPNPRVDAALRWLLPLILGVSLGLACPRAEKPTPCKPRVTLARAMEVSDGR